MPGPAGAVLVERNIDGWGLFTAYADGRVRVKFVDRALLRMDGARKGSLRVPRGAMGPLI